MLRHGFICAADFTCSTATNSRTHSPSAFNATSGDDVSDPRRNVSRITAGVRLSGSVRRSRDSNHCVRCNPARLTEFRVGQADVWTFNIFGTIDLLAAITTATIYNAPVAMGPAYWIPAFWVPLLLVTHYVTFIVLWKHWNRAANFCAGPHL